MSVTSSRGDEKFFDALGWTPHSGGGPPRGLCVVDHTGRCRPEPLWLRMASLCGLPTVLLCASAAGPGPLVTDIARACGSPLPNDASRPLSIVRVPPWPLEWAGSVPAAGSGGKGKDAGAVDPARLRTVYLPIDGGDASDGPHPLAELFNGIAAAVGPAVPGGGGPRAVVVIDEIVPIAAAVGIGNTLDFVELLNTLNVVTIVSVRNNGGEEGEDDPLVRGLVHASRSRVSVRPLETGYSTQYDGSVSVYASRPGTREHITLEARDVPRRLLFVTKKGSPTSFFVPGAVG